MRIALLPALVAILVIANGAWANTYDNVDYRFRVHWYRAADRGQVRAAAHPAGLQRLASTQPPSVDQVDMLHRRVRCSPGGVSARMASWLMSPVLSPMPVGLMSPVLSPVTIR
jgi:hypothetical protein